MNPRPDTIELDSGQTLRVLEDTVSSAPLGLRFWDAALGQLVGDGLAVRARPLAGGPIATARQTSRGVYGFHSLPTTADAERGHLSDFPSDAADRTAYAVSVRDVLGRYVPLCLTVEVPMIGVQPLSSPGFAVPPGFALLSAASRTVPTGFLAVRADLCDADRPLTGQVDAFEPARHALVTVRLGADVWYGVSDAGGRVMVLMPVPTMLKTAVGSGPIELGQRHWDVEIAVQYDRLAPTAFPGLPDFGDIAAQQPATARFTETTFTDSAHADLAYGVDLIVRTPHRSDLLVKAPAHP